MVWAREGRRADLLEQALRIDELGMALDRRHTLYPPHAGRVQRAQHKTGEPRRQRRGTLSVVIGDRVSVLDVVQRGEEVLRAVDQRMDSKESVCILRPRRTLGP